MTKETPKPGRRTPSKPGSLSPCAFSPLEPAPTKAKTEPAKETPGQGKGRAGQSTYLLPVLNCTRTSTLHSTNSCAELTGPGVKTNGGPTPTPCDCGALPTVSAVLVALLCVLSALPWRKRGASKENQSQASHVSHAKSCKNAHPLWLFYVP